MGIWKGPFLRPATGCNSEVSCSHFQRLDVAATGPYSDLSHDCPGAAPCWPLTPGLKTDWGAGRGIALPFLAVKVGRVGVWVGLFGRPLRAGLARKWNCKGAFCIDSCGLNG